MLSRASSPFSYPSMRPKRESRKEPQVPIPAVHDMNAQVVVSIPGAPQRFTGRVVGIGREMGGEAFAYKVEPDDAPLCLISYLRPEQVRRIVRADFPGGDTIIGTIGGTGRDEDGNINGYGVCYLNEPNAGAWMKPEWVTPL